MRVRTPAVALVLIACAGEVAAQPIAPPRRPTFSSYSNLYSPGGGYYGYGAGAGGFNPYGFGAGVQQAAVLNQLNQTNAAVANLQQFLAFGVNPMSSPTGRGATFNNLSHWYPTYRGQGVPFAAGGGGFGGPVPYRGTGAMGLMNTAMTGAATANAIGGAAAPRTSGNGIPVGGAKR
ncbi:hypothetical protein [Urbifossiella limnaea]|uniref:Uncharacterized protein n=1 Tax=Urbifossiella limnaea TaxID=2528023 RepID=A0A517XRD3_9BACT|nr:hypothetical protein [Urbifossiella limnaea]QDU20070.1 hypothetical protein ETAA1_20130 [Urbifossiella limnaea]